MDYSLVDRDQVSSALKALKAYVAKKAKKDLLSTHTEVLLQFSVKKVVLKQKTIRIPLPHCLVDESTSICLFVADVDRSDRDYTVTVDAIRQKLDDAGVKHHIEIVPLKQLKLEYKEYESKRKLLTIYDVFLADATIVRLLPPQLGKHFYVKKRHIVQVNLKRSDLCQEIDRVLSVAQCVSGRGSSSQVTVASLSQSEDDAIDNIVAAVNHLSHDVVGGAINVRSFNLKVQDGPALPIYISSGSKDEVKIVRESSKRHRQEPEEVTTVISGKILITGRRTVVTVRDIKVKEEDDIEAAEKVGVKTKRKKTDGDKRGKVGRQLKRKKTFEKKKRQTKKRRLN